MTARRVAAKSGNMARRVAAKSGNMARRVAAKSGNMARRVAAKSGNMNTIWSGGSRAPSPTTVETVDLYQLKGMVYAA